MSAEQPRRSVFTATKVKKSCSRVKEPTRVVKNDVAKQNDQHCAIRAFCRQWSGSRVATGSFPAPDLAKRKPIGAAAVA
jgi:hypothetical protein